MAWAFSDEDAETLRRLRGGGRAIDFDAMVKRLKPVASVAAAATTREEEDGGTKEIAPGGAHVDTEGDSGNDGAEDASDGAQIRSEEGNKGEIWFVPDTDPLLFLPANKIWMRVLYEQVEVEVSRSLRRQWR